MTKPLMITAFMSILFAACDSESYRIQNLEGKANIQLKDDEAFLLRCYSSGGTLVDVGEDVRCQCGLYQCNGETTCEDTDQGIRCAMDDGTQTLLEDLCSPGEVKCASDFTALEVCQKSDENPASWVRIQDCPYGCEQDSVSKAYRCRASECVDGEKRCMDDPTSQKGVIQTCVKEKWTGSSMCEGTSCDKMSLDCGECLNETEKCDENEEKQGVMKHCENGAWVDRTLCENDENPISCNAQKTGCGSCLNDDTSCTNEVDEFGSFGMLSTCKSGQWVTDDCVYKKIRMTCKENGLECRECLDGQILSCSAGKQTVCKDGTYVRLACPNGAMCKEDGSECACEGDVTECVNGEDGVGFRFTCDSGSGAWSSRVCRDNESQKYVSCKSETECGGCLSGSMICNNNDEGEGILYLCKDGVVEQEQSDTCQGKSCNSKRTGCGDCRNQDQVCVNDIVSGVGKLRTCVDGLYQTEYCKLNKDGNESDVSCNVLNESSQSCGECLNGTKKCENDESGIGILHQCEHGKWKDENDEWYNGSACSDDVSCNSDGTACGDCNDNDDVVCIDTNGVGSLNSCENGAYHQIGVCQYNGHGLPCKHLDGENTNSSECVVCQEGDKKCEMVDGVAKEFACENNEWSMESEPCTNATDFCADGIDGAKVCACENGDVNGCANNEANVGILRVCVNGEYVDQKCDNQNSCHGNTCGECQNLSMDCNSIILFRIKFCDNGNYSNAINVSKWLDNEDVKFTSCSSRSFTVVGNYNNAESICFNDEPNNIGYIFSVKHSKSEHTFTLINICPQGCKQGEASCK